jgi:fused signal recognition particle receptor
VKPERAVSATRILAPSTRERSDQQLRGFGKLMGTLTKRSLTDEQFDRIFTDLEIGLLEANTAYDAVQAVKENLRAQLAGERVSRFSAADDVSRALKESITALFAQPEDLVKLADAHEPLVIMLIGINGSGKTTTAAKLARAYQRAGKRPVLAAADTFRAAAIQQLEAHAKALDCRIIKHDYGADPTAVAFDAVSHARSGKADVVLIDTAGRLHSNENLLKELEKLKRIIKPHRIIFVGESIAGNDLLEQAQTFNEKIGIDGIILTKTDVDESGGGMLSVSHVTGKPIDYVCSGQGYDDLTFFSQDTVARLLGLE